MSTVSLMQLVKDIDSHAKKILKQGGDEALLRSLSPIMGAIKQIMDESTRAELDAFCEKYNGFYRCMKCLETIASSIADGTISVSPSQEPEGQLARTPQHQYVLSKEMVSRYDRTRNALRDLHAKFTRGLTREHIKFCAKQLEILGRDALHLNTEHEMNLFFDYCLYQSYQNDSNAIQKALKQYQGKDEETVSLFKAASNGYFAYLQILKPVGDVGLVVFDLERQTEHLMIDRGLSAVAKKPSRYTIVTHIIDLDDFIITTGASTPVNIDTHAGAKVQRRHANFVKKLVSGKVELNDRSQYVTDLYKICLHEDIAALVSSATFPFGEEALKTRINSSAATH